MTAYFFALAIVFGAIIGSFLNVVILRYNTGRGHGGRSFCFSCGKTLEWYELIPVLSFIFLRGRCGGCRTRLSFQYPLVEILTGIIFFLIVQNTLTEASVSLPFFLSLFLLFFISCVLIIITVYDFRHKIIPDDLVFAFIFSALFYQLIPFLVQWKLPDLLNFLAGPIFFLLFFLLWLISDGQWMGFGDAKLVIGIGLLLGLSRGAAAIILAFWIGAAVSLAVLGIQRLAKYIRGIHRGIQLSPEDKGLTIKSEIPFAPFLIAGTFLALFLNLTFAGISSWFIF